MNIRYILICLFSALTFLQAKGQIVYSDPLENLEVEGSLFYLIDKEGSLSIHDIYNSDNFKPIVGRVHNFGITSAAIWFKIPVENRTDLNNLILQVEQPIIDEIDFYEQIDSAKFGVTKMGEYLSFSNRLYHTPEYYFDVKVPSGQMRTFYARIKCKENMQVPFSIGSRISIINKLIDTNIASGIYFGIMIVSILYNLFIYSTLKDKSYLFYVVYIFLVLCTQTSLQGYTFKYMWPNFPKLAEYSPFIFPAFVGIVGLEFFKHFLQLKNRKPLYFRLSFIFLIPYFVSIGLGLSGYFSSSFRLVEITATAVSIFMLSVAYVIYKDGYSEARFFLIGWTIFLLGICIYVLKDFELLPYNGFTRYTMHFGSAVEVILLSFALADKINILKLEKEESQAEALAISQQNQKLIQEQNIILEQKVHERTVEIESANRELNLALNNLKDTQSQLVNSEKMASLGQLTAGIAHEINNPINFVRANVNPLRLDIQDVLHVVKEYEGLTPSSNLETELERIEALKVRLDMAYIKSEIDTLLNGIEDGARRTAEIVSGLKNFSRLDESDLKEANINEGIQSTIILIRSSIPKNVMLVTELGDIPVIECYPGKLNQVFMNFLTNSIYALKQKSTTDPLELKIRTYQKDNKVYAEFSDTGIGMSEQVKKRVFEPFFTTKDVGEGTGLGMSIVFKIVESHHAKVDIHSEEGVGTTITLILNPRISN